MPGLNYTVFLRVCFTCGGEFAIGSGVPYILVHHSGKGNNENIGKAIYW